MTFENPLFQQLQWRAQHRRISVWGVAWWPFSNWFLAGFLVCYHSADTKLFLSFSFCLSLLLFNDRWSKGIHKMRKSWKPLLRVLWWVYMRTHSLIKTTWQTFRRGRSCLSNLRELSEVPTATEDKGNSVDVVCLNFGGGFCVQNECPCCGLAGEAQGSSREGTTSWSIGKQRRNSNDPARLLRQVPPVLLCAKGRCCIGSNVVRTAEEAGSIRGYHWEKRAPVTAVLEGSCTWGDLLTMMCCLLPFGCLLPAPCEMLGVSLILVSRGWPCPARVPMLRASGTPGQSQTEELVCG